MWSNVKSVSDVRKLENLKWLQSLSNSISTNCSKCQWAWIIYLSITLSSSPYCSLSTNTQPLHTDTPTQPHTDTHAEPEQEVNPQSISEVW